MQIFMRTMTIELSYRKDFYRINIDNDLRTLIVKWDKGISESNKYFTEYEFWRFLKRSFKNGKLDGLRVLDLSQLKGIKSATSNLFNLHEIHLPDTVDYVNYTDCRYLRRLYAPGVKSLTINNAPDLEYVGFGDKIESINLSWTGIIDIELPPNIKLWAPSFRGCKNLRSVMMGVGTDLQPGTFENCTGLVEVTLPEDLTVIEPNVFKGCTNLKYIHGGKNIKHIFPSAFLGCKNLDSLDCTNFYLFSDLSISEKEWMDKMRPFNSRFESLQSIKNRINRFTNGLKKKTIDNPEKYIADSFFQSTESHRGILLNRYCISNTWIIWSLDKFCFFASTNVYSSFKENDIISFTIDNKPIVTISDKLYLSYPLNLIDLSKIKKEKESKEGNDEDYFSPELSLIQNFNNIVKYIDKLDISSIIDSYTIEVKTWWHIYPGRDDSKFYKRIAKSDYSDIYLDSFLPQEKIEDYSNGSCPWNYSEEEDRENEQLQESAKNEMEWRRKEAHEKYSKTEHALVLLEEQIKKEEEYQIWCEYRYHIKAAQEFIHHRFSGDREKSLRELYRYTLFDILYNKD